MNVHDVGVICQQCLHQVLLTEQPWGCVTDQKIPKWNVVTLGQ